MMKVCTKCKDEKPVSEFRKRAAGRYGVSGHCKLCAGAWEREYYLAHPDRFKAKEHKYLSVNREKRANRAKELYPRRKEKALAATRKWRMNNKEKIAADKRRWQLENADLVRAAVKARSKRVRKATPLWADRAAIRAFYLKCPKGMTVDHIVPLNGRTVCGLHVLNNLQYLGLAENSSKSNHYNGWVDNDDRQHQQPRP